MQGGNPEFSQKFSEQIMNSALYRSAFCRSFSRRSVGVLIYRLILCRWVFKIHMQLALDHAVIQLAALIRLAAVATLEQRVRAEQILLHRAVFCLSLIHISEPTRL